MPKPFTPDITSEQRISVIVKAELKLATSPPLNEEFANLGASHEQLRKIQNRISTAFNGRTVPSIFFTDTVYTITDRLTKPNTDARIKH